jgi:4a-hydroxytetrahydrobiopterin dehydratase
MRELLSDDAIIARLDKVPGWEREGDEIKKTYKLESFPAALVFASTVGHLAEGADHHPDIHISWRNVTLSLSTHSAGGLTGMDFDLAEQIEALPIKASS